MLELAVHQHQAIKVAGPHEPHEIVAVEVSDDLQGEVWGGGIDHKVITWLRTELRDRVVREIDCFHEKRILPMLSAGGALPERTPKIGRGVKAGSRVFVWLLALAVGCGESDEEKLSGLRTAETAAELDVLYWTQRADSASDADPNSRDPRTSAAFDTLRQSRVRLDLVRRDIDRVLR